MQIRSIVLYSRRGDIRKLDFHVGGLSIVTGASKTGKSALIEIVDYCLGRASCNVPVGAIRDSVSWFGLLLQIGPIQCYVARRSPDVGEQSHSEIHFQSGAAVEIPTFEQLKPNSNIDALESQLTSLLGISPNLNVSATEAAGASTFRINVRHCTFLTFQQQDEIASKKLLFHRQGEEFIPQAIRQTLPYFIGAISEDRLVKLNELERLKKEAEDLDRRLQEYERSVGSIDRAIDLVREAQRVGLIEVSAMPADRGNVDNLLLRTVAQPLEQVPTIIDDQRDELQRERLQLMREYRDLRERIKAAEGFEREQLGFRQESDIQASRLRSINLFSPKNDTEDVCPVCLSKPSSPTPSYKEIADSLRSLETRLTPLNRQVTNVRDHIKVLYDQLGELRKLIERNWSALSATIAASKATAAQENSYRQRSYVNGRISLYLQSRQELFGDEPLEEKIVVARARIGQLTDELASAEIEDKQTSILNTIGVNMSTWGKELNLEFSHSPLRIDIRKLNVVADTPHGPIPLDKMGGGENWVGYHLVALAALHAHLVSEKRPVPRFLMLDQPSQVYFPQDRPMHAKTEELDEDEIAVTRMFRFLSEVARTLDQKLQIIVMDHADLHDAFFQDAVVQRWRKGEALIPHHWISSKS